MDVLAAGGLSNPRVTNATWVIRMMSYMTTSVAIRAAPNTRKPALVLPRYVTIPPAINAAPSMPNITIMTKLFMLNLHS